MIYDVFPFFNELDILQIRLAELGSVVGTFVIVESPVTFNMKPKPLFFQENQARYKKYLHKIVSIIVDADKLKIEAGRLTNPWNIERYQRDYPLQYLKSLNLVKSCDQVICGDVDEIPKKEVILDCLLKKEKHITIQTELFRYYYNLYFQDWKHLFICRLDWLINQNSIHDIRKHRSRAFKQYKKGGWHFSSVGSIEHIMEKFKAYSHYRDNKHLMDIQRIKDRIKVKLHPFKNGKNPGQIKSILDMPKYIQDNQNYFNKLLLGT